MSNQCVVCKKSAPYFCPTLLGSIGAISPLHTTYVKCGKPLCEGCIHGCDGEGDRPVPSIIPHADDCAFWDLMSKIEWDNKYCTCEYAAQDKSND